MIKPLDYYALYQAEHKRYEELRRAYTELLAAVQPKRPHARKRAHTADLGRMSDAEILAYVRDHPGEVRVKRR